MAWIRKNPHLLTLIVLALGVLAASAVLAMNTQSFNDRFSAVQATSVQGDKIPPLDMSVLDAAQAELEKPAQWTPPKDPDPKGPGVIFPFVPPLYSIQDDKPLKSGEGSHYTDPLTKQPIPDRWFIDHGLNVTDPLVAGQDPDGDGFTNADEFRAQTDPKNKESHPPYYTKLWFKQIIRVPFRLVFKVYDGDPKKDKMEDMTFQINTLDLRQPSEFLKIGDMVRNTKFKIEKFEFKMANVAATGSEEDSSELTLLNTETNVTVVLVYGKVVNSPDVFAVLTYLWPQPPLEFRVRKLGPFILLPEKDQRYQLLDVTDDQAVIKLPSGEQQTVSRLPAGYP